VRVEQRGPGQHERRPASPRSAKAHQRIPGQQCQRDQQGVHARFLAVVNVERRHSHQERSCGRSYAADVQWAKEPPRNDPGKTHTEDAEDRRRETQRPLAPRRHAADASTDPAGPARDNVVIQGRLDVVCGPAGQFRQPLPGYLCGHRLVVPDALRVEPVQPQAQCQPEDRDQQHALPSAATGGRDWSGHSREAQHSPTIRQQASGTGPACGSTITAPRTYSSPAGFPAVSNSGRRAPVCQSYQPTTRV